MFASSHSTKDKHSMHGFTLVESLVAISILLVVIVGPLTIAQKGMQNAFYAGEQTTAVYLAQEAVEHMQRLRDDVALESFQDYKDGVNDVTQNTRSWHSNLDSYCKNGRGCDINFVSNTFEDCGNTSNCRLNTQTNISDRVYGYGAGTFSPYTRVIKVGSSFDAEGGVPVTVVVSWSANLFNATTKSVTLQTYIYDHYSRYEN